MVALGVIASPRPGGNTATAVGDVLARLGEAGADTSELRVTGAEVAPIADCAACIAAGRCTIDDGFDAIMEPVYAADLLVLGTPLYWYGPSAQMKAFLDRWSCLLDREEERFRARMRGTRVALVLAQGELGFYEAAPCIQMLEWSMRYLEMPVVARIVVVGHARGDYAGDASQRAAVAAAADGLADAGSADLMPPWFHVRPAAGDGLGGIFDAQPRP